MGYPGNKNSDGVYQTIINQIPPHDVYIEPFAGSASIFHRKRKADRSILIDVDASAIEALQKCRGDRLGISNECGITYLQNCLCGPEALAYCDPPYVLSSRRSQEPIYTHEMTDDDHRRFLRACRQLSCMVMISGYQSSLYDEMLHDWRVVTFTAMTHRGPATEYLWMNYPEPVELHDYRYLGKDWRQRQDIRRKILRWSNRLKSLPAVERNAIMAALVQGEA